MPKRRKSGNLNQAADRFYDYIMVRRDEILRYIIAALVTGVIEFLMKRFLPLSGYGLMLPFGFRFLAMFYLLKYWVYREIGSGPFYTGRQMMIAIMIFTVTVLVFNQLLLLFPTLLLNYIIQAIQEILYFVFYQFIIFKEAKS